MIIKTSELIGPALDWAVAMAERKKVLAGPPIRVASIHKCLAGEYEVSKAYSPSTDWAIMGPIIERDGMNLTCKYIETVLSGVWMAQFKRETRFSKSISLGPTPLIAAARCYVSFMLGDEINIPEVLK
jgi:hypothetical protein